MSYVFRNKMKTLLLLFLTIGIQQLSAQCVFVNIKGPKCAGENNISATFSRNPYQIEWVHNNVVVQKSKVVLKTVGSSIVSGNLATQPKITGTHGIAVDNNGNIYVSDTINNRVVAFSNNNPNGVVVAGGNGNGNLPSQLNKPAGLFIDNLGNLFVTDQYNNRILRFAPGSTNGFLVAGGNGKGGAPNQLSDPRDVYVDAQGFIYIADAGNHRIQKWAQGGISGVTVAGGLGAGSDSLRLNSPQGVAVDKNDHIYVADSANHRVQKFRPNQSIGTTIMGQKGKGTGVENLFQPVDILVDAFGDVYVLEAGNSRVQQLSIQDAKIKTILGSSEKLNYPTGFTFDISGNLYILDQQNARVQQYVVDTVDAFFKPLQGGLYSVRATTFAGCVQESNFINVNPKGAINISGNTTLCSGESTEIKLKGSRNYNWSPNKWVTKINDSIFLVKPDSSITYNISSSSDSGCVTTRFFTVNVGLKSVPIITPSVCLSPDASKITTTIVGQRAASLNFYRSPDISAGSLFPTWNKVGSVFAGANGIGVESNQFGLPTSAFVDQQGNIYVADAVNNRIQFWKKGDTFGRTVAGGKGQGFGNEQLNYPTNVFVDASSNIYVVDQNNHRVQFFARGDTTGRTVAGGYGIGNGKYQLNSPSSVFVDQYGNIYVADAGNHRVQKWSNSGNEVITVAGNGLPGNGVSSLNNPQGLFVDQRNNLFVADAENHRVLMYDQTKLSISVVAGNKGSGILMNQLNFPTGIYVDANSNLFITDRGNNRIQRWGFSDTTGVTVAGSVNGISGFSLDQFQLPNSIGFDQLGNMIVADTRNIRVLQYSIAAGTDSVFQTRIPGTYIAKSTSFSGCVTNSGNAFVVVAPQLKVKTDSSTICEGTQTRLFVTGSNNYKWSPTTVFNSSKSDTVIVRPLTTTKYAVEASSVSGCKATADVVITVYKKPVISIVSPSCISAEPMRLSTSPKVRNVLWTLNNNNLVFKNTSFSSSGETIIGKSISADTAQFGQPNYVYVDQNNHIYVCDKKNNRIQKWLPGAKIGTTIAGGKGAGNRLSQLNNPQSIFITADGLLYIADSDNDRVLLWKQGDSTGKVVAGGNGRGDKANQLAFPTGIFVDPYGSIFIADALNARVQLWEKESLSGKTVAGGNFAGAGASQLSYPLGVFVDPRENIYIADAQNDRVQRWKLGESIGTTVAGGNGKGNNPNQLVNPTSVFLDGNNQLIITESGTFNRVKSWEIGVDTGSVIVGGVIKGDNANQLDAPANAVVDMNGNLYVSDLNNFRIQRYVLADSTFSFNPPVRGIYSAQANLFNGCAARSDNFILDSGLIPAKPTGIDVQYCLNETPKPLVATGDRLRWYSVANGGVGALTPPLPSTAYIGNTNYWVSSLNPSFGCESIRQKITVTTRPLPVAKLSIVGNQNIMPGDTTILKSLADSNRTKNKFTWYRNGTKLSALPDTANRLFVFYSTIGKYHFAITDTNKCIANSDTLEIKAALAAEQEMYLFPNPVQHSTKIVFKPLANDKTFIKVVSNGGLVMMNKQINTSNIFGNMVYDLTLTQLPKGVYTIEIVTGSGRIIAHKQFIKL